MGTTHAESAHLERISADFSTEDGFNAQLIDMRFRAILPLLEGVESCIELGCSDGRMTALLARVVPRLTAVDGSESYTEAVRRRLPGVEVVCSLFEQLDAAGAHDAALLGHVLEHVEDPVATLKVAAALVRPGGLVVATVPNALSLHRLAGHRMGLLDEPWSLNDEDRRIGHRRVYTPATFEVDVRAAGLEVLLRTGVFLKPLSNGQIERDWSPELIRAYEELGPVFADHAAEILVAARRPAGGAAC